MQKIDTVATKSIKGFAQPAQRDTAKKDTTRVPIGWNPSVADWDATSINEISK